MPLPVFIGDETTACGYRLAGIDVRVPSLDAVPAELARALAGGAPLVLITAEFARAVDSATLHAAMARLAPPLLIVADAAGRVPVPDVAAAIRGRVGLS